MKIGIITILKVNNYGAELQAYATQAILKKLGYDAEIIDYLFYKNPEHVREKMSQPCVEFSWKSRVKEWLYPKIQLLKAWRHKKQLSLREERFKKFHKENTSLSPTYRRMSELYAASLDYDVCVTGSDQVWNPGVYSSLEPYFLTFASKGCKRISYAASFGVGELPENALSYYKEKLEAYHAIGVREKNAVDLVRKVADKEATWVLDPTLLLTKEDWLKVAHPVELPFTDKYILIYELTPCSYIRQLADYYSEKLGMRVVRICKGSAPEDKKEDIVNIIDAGPAEFLHLFANAGMIITNSFHGTAFSINFGKDFYTVLPLRKQNNSRQRSLLELFGLSERLLVEGDDPKRTEWTIDYTSVNKILVKERTKSIYFLEEAVNGK